jgi:hypothetical protein
MIEGRAILSILLTDKGMECLGLSYQLLHQP